MDCNELNERFAMDDAVRFEPGEGGLPRATLRAEQGEAHVYTHGAHVTHFQPQDAEPVLWMSKRSWFAPGKPIRGGVPVCFPWFGPHPEDPEKPAHGFARLMEWTVESATLLDGGEVCLVLGLGPTPQTRELWDATFSLSYTVTVGQFLRIALEVHNGQSAPFTISEALHSYFCVSEVRNIRVCGLEEYAYLDKMADGQRCEPSGKPITFAAETDRVYLDTQPPCTIEDDGLNRRIRMDSEGSASTVVWNPWTAKAARMEDYDDQEWPGMVCVETANAASNVVTVPPGQTHRIAATISVESNGQ